MTSYLTDMPHLSTILSAYASISAMIMLVRTILNEIIPQPVHSYIATKLSKFLSFNSSDFTFLVERRWEAVSNETFRAVEVYLPTIARPTTSSLLVGSNNTSNAVAEPKLGIPVGAKVVDYFQGMRLEWTLECKEELNKYSALVTNVNPPWPWEVHDGGSINFTDAHSSIDSSLWVHRHKNFVTLIVC